VTDALHILEGERVLRCTRAMIVVRDRDGLETAAGVSYGAPEAIKQVITPKARGITAPLERILVTLC
jgi:hypothetical protein